MYKEKKVSVIIAAAGSSSRMGGINKQYIEIGGISVLARTVKAFERNAYTDEIIIAVRPGDEENCRQNVIEQYGIRKVNAVIEGGTERQYSVRKALEYISPDTQLVLVHDGARPFVTQRLIHDVIDAADANGAAVPCVSVKDTIKIVNDGLVAETPDRSQLRAIQTPQGFSADLLRAAYDRVIGSEKRSVTDDASVVEAFGHEVAVVESDEGNFKITTQEDINRARAIVSDGVSQINDKKAQDAGKKEAAAAASAAQPMPCMGIGYDVHAFSEDRKLVLGGVEIPHERGLLGHSDADVLVHAVIDALLGAAGLGDIGAHFPDTDPQYEGISSIELLKKTKQLLAGSGWKIVNVDAVVIAQRPKISPYIPEMRENMADVLKVSRTKINIKGTTTEGLGFTGREEGVAAQAIACVVQ